MQPDLSENTCVVQNHSIAYLAWQLALCTGQEGEAAQPAVRGSANSY